LANKVVVSPTVICADNEEKWKKLTESNIVNKNFCINQSFNSNKFNEITAKYSKFIELLK
jgi:hypothetical protein